MRRILLSIFLALVITLNTSCSQALSQLISPLRGNSSDTVLTIDQVVKSNDPGQFALSGKAALPEQTKLTVSAIRSLTLVSDDQAANQDRLYGILDRRTTLVEDGRWQAQLSLWEVNSEGYYQESWQGDDVSVSDNIKFSPSVNFTLTVESQDILSSKSPKIDGQISRLIRFTPEGEPYLSASKNLIVPLPQKVKASGLESLQESEVNWQDRSLIDPTKNSIEKPVEIPFHKEDNLPISPNSLIK